MVQIIFGQNAKEFPILNIAGTFTNWEIKPMELHDEHWEFNIPDETLIEKGIEKIYFKFIDGESNWLVDGNFAIEVDEHNNQNNVMVLSPTKESETVHSGSKDHENKDNVGKSKDRLSQSSLDNINVSTEDIKEEELNDEGPQSPVPSLGINKVETPADYENIVNSPSPTINEGKEDETEKEANESDNNETSTKMVSSFPQTEPKPLEKNDENEPNNLKNESKDQNEEAKTSASDNNTEHTEPNVNLISKDDTSGKLPQAKTLDPGTKGFTLKNEVSFESENKNPVEMKTAQETPTIEKRNMEQALHIPKEKQDTDKTPPERLTEINPEEEQNAKEVEHEEPEPKVELEHQQKVKHEEEQIESPTVNVRHESVLEREAFTPEFEPSEEPEVEQKPVSTQQEEYIPPTPPSSSATPISGESENQEGTEEEEFEHTNGQLAKTNGEMPNSDQYESLLRRILGALGRFFSSWFFFFHSSKEKDDKKSLESS
ncbi:Uip4p NDAI_0F02270 [Naumovozyma dairenensis CBS 421]|uniref:AMP-activated protein kinase glycogen-binding domain-containing protein n=1 Tax=Naumovozyma dairenensis (strain ATCC 10597 / BCRC 20456 / CBS 421 / NBRC 0211 / NRRL Y-12639) TaxID=1071378 RepID=G0WCN4_NAUDC|nr:hypothetical protein NDAI_0F02270 [Naumovozyma dairenensis CBS 421]CCD25545.1 hypothetical protein NDAI_0F02270 [Naumovozyma dairenensis CBS 421]